jgi:hypothetical protein
MSTPHDEATPPPPTLLRTQRAFALPLDAKTLELELYLKASGLKHTTEESAYPYSPVTGALPAMRWSRNMVGACDAVSYLQAQHCDLDQFLTPSQRADAVAFRTMLDDSLPFCVLFVLWQIEQNYYRAPKLDYAANVQFPNRLSLRYAEARRIRETLDRKTILTEEEAVARAQKCYELLTSKLSSQKYFFGHDRPTSLDIAMASHVAIHCFLPIRDNALKVMLDDSPALLKHSKHVMQLYSSYDLAFYHSTSPSAPINSMSSAVAVDASAATAATTTESDEAKHSATRPTMKTPKEMQVHPRDMSDEAIKKRAAEKSARKRPPTAEEIEEERKLKRRNWIICGVAFVGTVGYAILARTRIMQSQT